MATNKARVLGKVAIGFGVLAALFAGFVLVGLALGF